MGINYIWDTNIAIYYLQQQFPSKVEKFVDGLLMESIPVISAITEIELLCWKTASNKDLQILKGFISSCKVIELENPIKYRTAELRKEFNIKLPDAIIAATAQIFNLTLVTRNVKDFKSIEGLAIINPFEID